MKNKSLRALLGSVMKKYREPIMYIIFGVLATLVSVFSFMALIEWARMDPVYANVVSWIAAVTFAFFTNRFFVFQPVQTSNFKLFVSFFAGRVATLVLEEVILIVLLAASMDVMIVKFIGQAAVIISNYFISKLLVFRKK